MFTSSFAQAKSNDSLKIEFLSPKVLNSIIIEYYALMSDNKNQKNAEEILTNMAPFCFTRKIRCVSGPIVEEPVWKNKPLINMCDMLRYY
jgi:hypothetical protein